MRIALYCGFRYHIGYTNPTFWGLIWQRSTKVFAKPSPERGKGDTVGGMRLYSTNAAKSCTKPRNTPHIWYINASLIADKWQLRQAQHPRCGAPNSGLLNFKSSNLERGPSRGPTKRVNISTSGQNRATLVSSWCRLRAFSVTSWNLSHEGEVTTGPSA